MRPLITLTALTVLVGIATAADPPLPKSADQPMLVMAKAAKTDKGVVLTVRTMHMEPATRTITVKVPVTVQKAVDGKLVNETQLQEQQQQITVMQPMKWRTVDVPVDGKDVAAFDLKGQPIAAEKLVDLLKDEQPILAAPFGPIDPYFLQTTKDGTLVVRIPPEVLFPPQNAPPPVIERKIEPKK
jgi:hypothetical protein